ncbi:MAG: hypothetical protein Q4C06_06980, partial [Bacillota bacterium]|nr:hypothetical protein [Bacillota bacterium]
MKRIIVVLMSTVLVFSLVACGGKTESTPSEEKIQEEQEVVPLQMCQANNYLQDWELYQAEWQKLYLSEADAAAYSALAEVLKELNAEQDGYYELWAQDALADARLAQ